MSHRHSAKTTQDQCFFGLVLRQRSAEESIDEDVLIMVRETGGVYQLTSAAYEVEATDELNALDVEIIEDLGELMGWGPYTRAYRVTDAEGCIRTYFARYDSAAPRP